ncbi:MAG: metallophosphoesterase family protein [Candidatus Aenigmarchaeota archaeon]|nr:metallophosphoesterase family protein [Candidatus Aenigmarchaeota archaeon]
MRLMIISDVHANLPALQAVFKDLKHNFGLVDYVLCAGDLIGYGPYPNEVCDAMRRLKNLISVKGELDQATIDGNLKGLEGTAAESIKWTRKVITQENLDFLDFMDTYRALKIQGLKIFLVHGSPSDFLNGRISRLETLENLENYFQITGADIIISGQTHIPFVKELYGKYVINAGSVGMPTNENPKASYVFMDLDNMEINFRRVGYDIDSVVERMRELNFPEAIINRFYFG